VEARDVPAPRPGPGQVLVEVHAAGVNPLDFKIRDGKLRVLRRYSLPVVMGNELAGRIAELGPDVKRFSEGEDVFVRVAHADLGAFAEFAVVREGDLAKKPNNISMVEAAAVPLAALTAWQCLDMLGVAAGTRVLVHAGVGGVGSFAVQLAKARGARVITTCSTRNVELAQSLGADEVIDYTQERFEEKIRNLPAVLDTVGGETLARSFEVVARGGKLVSIAGPPEPGTATRSGFGGAIGALFWLASFGARRHARQREVTYAYHFMHPNGRELDVIGEFIAGGKVRALVDKVYPLEAAREALAHVEGGRTRGKVVLAVRGEGSG
jgi:alcohol dehydrogenase